MKKPRVKAQIVEIGFSVGGINYAYEGDDVQEALRGMREAFERAERKPLPSGNPIKRRRARSAARQDGGK